jgi:hypothetical protein
VYATGMPIIIKRGSQREFTFTFLVIANILTIIIPWCAYLLILRDAPVFLFPYLMYVNAFFGLLMLAGLWVGIIDVLLAIPWIGEQSRLLLDRLGISIKINWKKFIAFLAICNFLTIIVPWVIYAYFFLILPSNQVRWGFSILLPIWHAGMVLRQLI